MEEFEALLFECRNAVERFVYFKLPSKTDADDVIQEVFLTAYQKFNLLKDKAAFKAWIISIARNKCRDYFRSRAIKFETPLDELSETYLVAPDSFGLVESDTVRETIDLLGENDKQILYLYFFRNMLQTEIAEQLDIPLGTVKSRLYTAKVNFKEKYPYPPYKLKGETIMKTLPEIMPSYTITKSEKAPFAVKWEELWGLFIVPKLGEKLSWGSYESENHRRTGWGEMEVTGKAMVHSIEGVEIKECRYNNFGDGMDDRNHFYVAQLTDTHCRILAENYEKDGVRKYFTFLDGDEFVNEWGYGENNCGKETHVYEKGKISVNGTELIAKNTDQLCDIVGRYTITFDQKQYDTVRVISLDSYYGQFIACEQYLDKHGRMVLWRRFNRDDWEFEHYQQRWREKLPDNERLCINGETYVHWYDCITDYIL